MKRAIEFEETVKVRHQVIVEVYGEDEIDSICHLTGDSFDDILAQIDSNTGAVILESSEEYSCESENGLEYYDDYWTDEEKSRFPG